MQKFAIICCPFNFLNIKIKAAGEKFVFDNWSDLSVIIFSNVIPKYYHHMPQSSRMMAICQYYLSYRSLIYSLKYHSANNDFI